MTEWERERKRVCVQCSLLSSTEDLSLPDVSVGFVSRRIAAHRLKLNSASFSFSLPFFLPLCPSLSLSPPFSYSSSSPFPAVFGAHENEGSSPPIVSVLSGAPQLDPSLCLSRSPFSPATLFLSRPLSLSSPCCDRAHLLDLGCMRSESNYPIGPLSHFSFIPLLNWILGVKLISPSLFA